ncbi:putative quinol monooxygenase [Psychromonas sp. KJ10-10]|uniref:putative quinol monooxygenase n=1 Tax=Psychromonas sp. KJ10-10 TaxID=3391823 RepID=UPI0039B3AB81
MLSVIASILIKESKVDQFKDIFIENIPNVLAEKGCLEYRITVDFDTGFEQQLIESNSVTIIEKWNTFEDFHNHRLAPHMIQHKLKVEDLVESVSIKVLQEIS